MRHYKNKKVLVTGGAGFIGSHLVDALVEQGAYVTVLDNLSTGSINNLAQSKSNITFIEGDIRDSQACLQSAKEQAYIFHLAACVSVPQSMQDPQFCHDVNINGTFNMLEAARKNNVRRFVLSSSCAVYGQQTEACSEQTACNPASPYAYSKWMGELLCQQYSQLFNVPSVCLRYFNVVGERQNPYGPYAGVYAKFSDLMQQNKPVTIFGDGQQTRDFVSVAQVVQANMQLALLSDTQCIGNPVNIGTGTTTTVLTIFNRLKNKYPDYQHDPIFAAARDGDIVYSCANTALYKRLTSL